MVDAPLDGFEADVELRTELDPAAVHTVLFTSGTTGEPKPVELTVGQPGRRAAAALLGGHRHATRTIAGSACCRSSTSRVWRSSCAAPDAATTAVIHEQFDAEA